VAQVQKKMTSKRVNWQNLDGLFSAPLDLVEACFPRLSTQPCC
jgi:hypothetical protein